MLKTLKTLLKLGIFASAVLVLGSWLRWDGKTISDQIKTKLSHAELGFAGKMQKWAGKLESEAQKTLNHQQAANSSATHANTSDSSSPERQKLRALIHEIDGPHEQ
ncbi:MAG: hypothetical protein AABZ06_12795 [Bdellovibrionota bacterium]